MAPAEVHRDGGYDVAVVGSGGAAFGAAIRAANLGAQVVMVERATVGGTCVNVGCVPSKTLLAGADARHTAASHPFAGLPAQAGHADMGALVAQKDELVGQAPPGQVRGGGRRLRLRDRPGRGPIRRRRHPGGERATAPGNGVCGGHRC